MSRFNQWLPYNVLPCQWGECKALQVRTKLQLRKQSAGELGGVPAVTPSGGGGGRFRKRDWRQGESAGDRASPQGSSTRSDVSHLEMVENTILSADWCEANQTF